jgi:hypothetical protein
MTKKEILEEIKKSISHIESVQKMAIEPHEEKVTDLLKKLYPKMNQDQAEDWMMDVIYNNPVYAFRTMEEIYGE